MSTKGIIVVKQDKQVKLAQPVWNDAYPSYLGLEILKFLRKDFKKDKFNEKVKNLRFAQTNKECIDLEERQWNYRGFKILKYIQSCKDNIVFNALEGDGVVPNCFEFGYLINLDNNTFEIYAEYINSRKNLTETKSKEFRKFNLLRKYSLDKLPTTEIFQEIFDLA